MIPKLHYISQGNSPKAHLDHIQNACAAGAELVVLDIQNSSEKKFLKIAKQAREITAHFQTRLIISAHYKIAKEIKADGVHLDTTAPCPAIIRKELLPWQLIGNYFVPHPIPGTRLLKLMLLLRVRCSTTCP